MTAGRPHYTESQEWLEREKDWLQEVMERFRFGKETEYHFLGYKRTPERFVEGYLRGLKMRWASKGDKWVLRRFVKGLLAGTVREVRE